MTLLMSALPSRPTTIFISAAASDGEFCARLAYDLRAALGSGDAVWYEGADGENNPSAAPDAARRETVRRELEACSIFVVILSPEAMASRTVNDQIDLAWRLRNSPAGKVILPVLYRPCAVRDDLETLQWISFAPPQTYASALAELVSAVRRAAEAPKAAQPSSAASSAHAAASTASSAAVRTRTPRLLAGWPAIVALLLVLVASSATYGIRLATARGAATSTPQAKASASATPTATPELTPIDAAPYFVAVPGPCNGNVGWSFVGDPNRVSYVCLADGLRITTHSVPIGSSPGFVLYNGRAGPMPPRYTMSVRVTGLTSGACILIELSIYADGSAYYGHEVEVCQDGDWSVQIFSSSGNFMLGQGQIAPVEGAVQLTFTRAATSSTLAIGSALKATVTDPIPFPATPLTAISLQVDNIGSATWQQFQFTPNPYP